MIATIDWRGQRLTVDLSAGQALSIPVNPHGPQPSFFSPAPATARPLTAGEFIGDMRQGGSCNAEVIEFAPHCHGTHTECIGHVQRGCATVQETIYADPVLAQLVTVRGTPIEGCAESHAAAMGPDQLLITRDELARALPHGLEHAEALLLRTTPNDAGKRSRDYAAEPNYPVLSREAMAWLASAPLRHLLLDTPSLDPADDDGRLANHRCWWGLDGTAADGDTIPAMRSITEMIFVPDEIADSLYWLNIELSPLVSDATPSRPVVYPVTVEQT